MNKIVKFLLLGLCLFYGVEAFSSGTCPTPQELRSKNEYFQQKAMAGLSSQSSNPDDAIRLLEEQTSYINGVFPGCVQYFKSTKNPDCSKLTTLATGYMLLDKEKQPAAKAQALGAAAPFSKQCSAEFQALQFLIK